MRAMCVAEDAEHLAKSNPPGAAGRKAAMPERRSALRPRDGFHAHDSPLASSPKGPAARPA